MARTAPPKIRPSLSLCCWVITDSPPIDWSTNRQGRYLPGLTVRRPWFADASLQIPSSTTYLPIGDIDGPPEVEERQGSLSDVT